MMKYGANHHRRRDGKGWRSILLFTMLAPFLLSCADVDVPGARTASIPSPTIADKKPEGINERPDSVLYLPLGSDVLVPEADGSDQLPAEMVGPFELRGETLAGALQLILADYEMPLAFETEEGLTRTITVSNLKGPLNRVVSKVCGLADLYCSYEDGLLVIKDSQTFTVTIPPIGGETDYLGSLAQGLQAITGVAPITESATRTIIYEATSRTAELAERYFQRLRSNTALIVYEIYIWEVQLNSDNATGIDWSDFGKIGGASINFPSPAPISSPISIGLPTWNDGLTFNTTNVLQFISNYGAVKTISQPQVTMLSGSQATLRVADTQSYVASLTRTSDNGQISTSTEIDSVDTGFTISLSSDWDNSTVYGNIEIEVQDVIATPSFTVDEETGSQVTVPQTTERELTTQIRIRPGDALLLAGLVRESDDVSKSGPGFKKPILPLSNAESTINTELVFMLKPRVIVYTDEKNTKDEKFEVPRHKMFEDNSDMKFEYNAEFPAGTLSKEMLDPSR